MPTQKLNEYLDAESSEEDGKSDYDSGAAEDASFSRTTLQGRRRPKTSTVSASSSADDNEDSSYELPPPKPSATIHETVATPKPEPPTSPTTSQPPKLALSKPLMTSTTNPPPHKPGIIYLSRIPPFMRPTTLRHLLSAHGPISRLFLTPEPPTTYLSRRARGGNKKRSYIDGWVEFSRRRDAKSCVDAINATTLHGGRRRRRHGWYADDVWNARYLRGFAWEDLMGGVRAEEREREERVRVGVRREGRERGEFLRGVEGGRVMERRKGEMVRRRRRRRREEEGGCGAEDGAGTFGEEEEGQEGGDDAGDDGDTEGRRRGQDGSGRRVFERRFRQNVPKGRRGNEDAVAGVQSEEAKRILGKIF